MSNVEGYAGSLCAHRAVYPRLERLVRAALSNGDVGTRVRLLKVLRRVHATAVQSPPDAAASAARASHQSAGRDSDDGSPQSAGAQSARRGGLGSAALRADLARSVGRLATAAAAKPSKRESVEERVRESKLMTQNLCHAATANGDAQAVRTIASKLVRVVCGGGSVAHAAERDDARLPPILGALAAIARLMPEVFAPHADAVSRVVESHLNFGPPVDGEGRSAGGDEDDGSDMSDVEADGGSGSKKRKKPKASASATAHEVGLIRAALKLLAAQLLPLTMTSGGAADAESGSTGDAWARERAAKLVKGAFTLLSSNGASPDASIALSVEAKARVRLAAACSILKFAKYASSQLAGPELSPRRWHSLAWLMHDSSRDVRRTLSHKLAACTDVNLMMGTRFTLPFLSLAALDADKELRAIAKEYLKQAVFKLRAFHHQQRIAWQFGDSEAGADDEADDTRMRPLLRLMPEYSIPYVLHLLAHHPEYPDDDEPMDVEDGAQPGAPALEDPRLKSMLKCLQMLLEPISFAQGADAGNLAFLMNLATSIQNFHRDVRHSRSALSPLAPPRPRLRSWGPAPARALGKVSLGVARSRVRRSMTTVVEGRPKSTASRGPCTSTSRSASSLRRTCAASRSRSFCLATCTRCSTTSQRVPRRRAGAARPRARALTSAPRQNPLAKATLQIGPRTSRRLRPPAALRAAAQCAASASLARSDAARARPRPCIRSTRMRTSRTMMRTASLKCPTAARIVAAPRRPRRSHRWRSTQQKKMTLAETPHRPRSRSREPR